MDEDTIKRSGKQAIDTTNIMNPVEPSRELIKRNFIYKLFKSETEKKQPLEKEKPQKPKLKTFEIVCVISKNSI